MAVKIRLARGGSKKRPYYRIVVADIRAPRDGRYIERVGSYNPLLPKDHEDRVKLDTDRIKEWLSKGAKPTDRVARFLDAEGILKREPRNNPQKAIQQRKLQLRKKLQQKKLQQKKLQQRKLQQKKLQQKKLQLRKKLQQRKKKNKFENKIFFFIFSKSVTSYFIGNNLLYN